MTDTKNSLSTTVLTHKIFYEDPRTKTLKTHYCDAPAYLKIRKAYNQKLSIDLGNGNTIVWTQFKGGERIKADEHQGINASLFIRQSSRKELRVNGEYEIILREIVDKRTQKVLKTDTEERLIQAYSQEDIVRYQKLKEAIKNRHKDGKTISEILRESLNR